MKPAGQNKRTSTIASKVKVKKEAKGNCTKSRQSNSKTAGKNPKIYDKKKSIQLLEGTESPSCQKPPLLPQNDRETNYVEVGTKMSTPQQGIPPNSLAKLALQLFPMDDVTRNVLEKDKHNPHVELIMGVRKKISSVVKHLITKWNTSSVPVGELMLFPYEPELHIVDGCKRWNAENTGICAGDIYKMLGSPSVFRLRYGWFPNINQSSNRENQSKSDTGRNLQLAAPSIDRALEEPADLKENEDINMLFVNEMSNISLSGIFSGMPTINMDSNQNNQVPTEGSSRLLFNFDSLDAAIASFKAQSTQISSASIWDADETCHAFSLQKNCGLPKDSTSKKPFPVKGSDFDEPLSKRDPDLVNPDPFSQDHHSDLSETEPLNTIESEEYKIDIWSSKQGVSDHGLQPHTQGLITANENDMGLSCINFDSLGPMEFGMPLPPLCKQNFGEESIDFNALLGFGNSRDASTSCS